MEGRTQACACLTRFPGDSDARGSQTTSWEALPYSILFILLSFFLSFFFFFLGPCPMAYGSSQVRGHIGAAAASLHHSHSNARSEPSLQQHHQILTPLSGARDWTCILIDTSWVLYQWTVTGAPQRDFSGVYPTGKPLELSDGEILGTLHIHSATVSGCYPIGVHVYWNMKHYCGSEIPTELGREVGNVSS